jgi:hypothetical protein
VNRIRCHPQPDQPYLTQISIRAGADAVYGAEITQHMCDVGEEACIMNGYFSRITMLDRCERFDASNERIAQVSCGTKPASRH